MEQNNNPRKPLVVPAAQGRVYDMGRMQAVFKADGEETAGRYSISEWWLEPGTRGPGVHVHSDDHIFRQSALTGRVALHRVAGVDAEVAQHLHAVALHRQKSGS